VELRRWRTVARRYIRFPKFDVPAAFADTLSLQLPNLILASLFGPVIAGFYMLADRAIVVPLALLGQALGQVIYSRSRETVADGSMLTMVVRTVKVLGSGVALFAVFSVPLGPLLFATVFGEEWRGAGLYASILFLGFGAQFVFSSISVALPASGGQHLSLAVNAMLLAVKSAALYFGYIRGSALDAIIAYSAVTVAGNALAIAVVIAHLERCAPNAAASPTAVDL
jgi:O-antigen/teichoic acid export membrane protein